MWGNPLSSAGIHSGSKQGIDLLMTSLTSSQGIPECRCNRHHQALANIEVQLRISEFSSRTKIKIFLIPLPQRHTPLCTSPTGLQPLFLWYLMLTCPSLGEMGVPALRTPCNSQGSLPGAPSSHPSNENCGPSAHDKIHHVGLAAPGSVRPGLILLLLVLSPNCTFFSSSTSL